MGNCFGEPEPVAPRRRVNPNSSNLNKNNSKNNPNQRRPQSPNAPIGKGNVSKNIQKDEIILGSSVSERREIDNDVRWKQLLDHTTTNLIDISQTTQPLDGIDAQQREYEHKVYISEINITKSSFDIFNLPVFNIPHIDELKNVNQSERELINKANNDLLENITNMTIEDQGDLVVSFEEQ